nr:ABC transporter substrate-binding protein [Clostridiales bacterium]
DYSLHYDVKIKAAKLLLENVGSTFVTPVYNGSASLRDAAGQMIENTAKSVRRKETVDDAYFDKLFSDVNSLYRLDQRNTGSAVRTDLGPMPAASKILLGALVFAWVMIGLYVLSDELKKKKMLNRGQKS